MGTIRKLLALVVPGALLLGGMYLMSINTPSIYTNDFPGDYGLGLVSMGVILYIIVGMRMLLRYKL